MRVAVAVAVVVLLAGCTGGEVPVSGDIQAWSFTDTEGTQHSNASAKGDPVVLFFMATWCTSCQRTAPKLAQIHDEFEARGLQVFSVSFDPNEDASDLNGWKSRYAQPWPHGVDTGSAMAKTFDITRQSSLVVLDANGAETKKWIYASPSLEDLRGAVDAAFAR